MIAFREYERKEIAQFLRRVLPRGQDEALRLEQYILVLEHSTQQEEQSAP